MLAKHLDKHHGIWELNYLVTLITKILSTAGGSHV